MAWRFEPGEPLAAAFRRVAAEEIATARAELAGFATDRERAVHQARRHFKRMRALLRLARPALGRQFAEENRRWRDAGRQLAGERDAAVLTAAFDAMAARATHLDRKELDTLRAELIAGPESADALPAVVESLLGELDEAASTSAHLAWPDEAKDLALGLRQGQARLRRSWRAARDGVDAEALHEWRKRLKDQMAQLGLLRKMVPDPLSNRREEEKRLAEILGEERDLLLLCRKLAGPVPPGTEASRDALLAEIAARRDDLRSQAWGAGAALSAPAPRDFGWQLAECWEAAAGRHASARRRRNVARPA